MTVLEEAITSPIPIVKKAIYAIGRPMVAMFPVDTSQEIQVGERIHRVIANELRGRLDPPGPDLDYVRAVGTRVASHVRRRDITYTFHLVEIQEANAFTHAGGHIYLFRGLYSHMKNEAQLACLLGHEIAHEDLMHTQDMVKPVAAVRRIQSTFPGAHVDLVRLITGLATLSMHLAYSEPRELEADALGMRLAFEASYDPREAIALYLEAGAYDSPKTRTNGTDLALQSHPNRLARVAALNKNVEELFEEHPFGPKIIGIEAFRKKHPIKAL